MTEVEVITQALAAGAAAGATGVAKAAVVDAYTALRDALGRRLSGRREAEAALWAQETDPGVWQATLGEELTESGADRDEEILATARRLLGLLDPDGRDAGRYTVDLREGRGVQVGEHNTQHNTFG